MVLLSLPENCPNTEFFLVRIFPHLDWIRKDKEYLYVFSPNVGIYGPKKTPYLDTFHAVFISIYLFLFSDQGCTRVKWILFIYISKKYKLVHENLSEEFPVKLSQI